MKIFTRSNGYVYKREGSNFYWIKYYYRGIPIRKSTRCTDKEKALSYLANLDISIDDRFEKVYQKIIENFPNLKRIKNTNYR